MLCICKPTVGGAAVHTAASLHIVNLKNSVKPGRKNLVKLLLFDFFDLIFNLQWCRIRRKFIFLISRHKVDLVIKTGGRSLARFFSFFLYQPLPIKWSWKHRTVSESARMCFKRKAVGNFVESGILYLNENWKSHAASSSHWKILSETVQQLC